MGAGKKTDEGALVEHAFWGTWKSANDPKLKGRTWIEEKRSYPMERYMEFESRLNGMRKRMWRAWR